jgi:hypothetical protein
MWVWLNAVFFFLYLLIFYVSFVDFRWSLRSRFVIRSWYEDFLYWYFLKDHSLSDHPYVLFDLAKTLQTPITSRKSKPPRADDIDVGLFNKTLADELEAFDNRHNALSANDIDSYTENVTSIIIPSASRRQKNNSETQPPLHGPMVDRRARNLTETHQKSVQKMVSLTPDGRQAVLQ